MISEDELKSMFAEAEARGDRETAIAIMDKLESHQPNFIDRVSKISSERNNEVLQTLSDLGAGVISPGEANLQILGKGVAGKALDIVGESVVTGIKQIGKGLEAIGAPPSEIMVSLGNAASAVIPDFIEEPAKEAIVNGWNYIKDGEIGNMAVEAVKEGKKGWDSFKKDNPNAAKDIESAVNIAVLFLPAKTKKNADPSVIKRTADMVDDKVKKQLQSQKDEFIKDLILPKQTTKERIDQVARTSEKGRGIFKRKVVNLSPEQEKIAQVIKTLPNVNPKNSLTKNYININKTLETESSRLERTLRARKIPLSKQRAISEVDDVIMKTSSENPLIVGDAARTVQRTGDYAKKLIHDSDGTAAGMLRARRDFDKWVLSQASQKKAFGDLDTAFSIGVREIRNKMNELTDLAVSKHAQRTGSVRLKSVREELSRQSQMFKALDNIAPKAADEHGWAIGRALQNSLKVLPVGAAEKAKREIGLLMGIGAFGASAYFAPYLAVPVGIGVTGYLGGKLVMSAAAKKSLSKVLKLVDRAIITSENPSMIKQLRADRALILEAIKASENSVEGAK